MASTFSISSCLEKMENRDKDFRFMACSDLSAELAKDSFKLDAESEKKLTKMLLKLLEDSSGDVQGVAVKCLGPFIKKIQNVQVGEILTQCANLLLKEKNNEVRDIASLGLNAVVEAVDAKEGQMVVDKIAARLIAAVGEEKPTSETKIECMQILEELLRRFGSLMAKDHERLQTVVLPQLKAPRNAAKKRAIGCLSQLSSVASDALFTALVTHLFKNAEEAKVAERKTYLQALSAVSVSVGYRLGKHINTMVPIVVKVIKSAGNDESDEELRENCLAALESLVRRCPKEVAPHIDTIVALSLLYVKHDPNYADDEDAGDDDEAADEDDGDDDDDGGDYSADDDVSWKVRRASAKVLNAVLASRPDQLAVWYDKIAPTLIARFKEREESVKIDVFAAFVTLVKQTIAASKKQQLSATADKSVLAQLRERVPAVVAGITRQLKDKSVKTRIAAFAVLRELVLALGGGLDKHIKELVPGLVFSLGDKSTNSNIKIETLALLRQLLASHPEAVFQPHVKALCAPVVKAVGDGYYKIAAEALRVVFELVRVLRPNEADTFDAKPFVPALYGAVSERLKATDADQEVKEATIDAVGLLVSLVGNQLSATELKDTLALLQDRLTNEITRLTAVKAWGRIAASPLKLDLSANLPGVVTEMAGFLRKQNRQLKQATLQALEVIARLYGAKLGPQLAAVVEPLAALVADSDLHLAHLALALSVAILRAAPDASAAPIRDKLYPRTLELVQSSLLSGVALQSLLALFGEIAASSDKKLGFDSLMADLQAQAKKVAKGASSNNIAQCLAVIVIAAPAKQRDATIAQLLKDVQKSDDAKQALALLCIGEIGRRHDLSGVKDLQTAVVAALDHANDDVKSGASFALGGMAVGSLAKTLPFILAEIKAQPKRQYLLLHSLREVIVRSGAEALKPHAAALLPVLFDNAQSDEDGSRNIVAECLGKLALVDASVVGELQKRLSSDNARARATVVSAIKFAIVEQAHAVDATLLGAIVPFMQTLADPALEVRRAALLALNWAVHNKPGLVRRALEDTLLPLLYAEAKVKPELMREVDLGPFKHKVDDGLENRKAAFETLSTLLEQAPDALDIPTFVGQLVLGLGDSAYDIKMLTHLILIRLAKSHGAELLSSLEALVEPLRVTVTTKPAQTAVKQDIERNDELVRSGLRVVVALANVENAASVAKFDEFLRVTCKTGELAEKYAAAAAEAAEAD